MTSSHDSTNFTNYPATQAEIAEDIALIRAMMQEGRSQIGFDGQYLALWGGLLTAAFGLMYLSVAGQWNLTVLTIWAPILLTGWILSFWLGWKSEKRERNSPVLRGYSSMQLAFGITMSLAFVMNILSENAFSGLVMITLTAGLSGVIFYAVSCLMQIGWLKIVAAGWWALLAAVIYKGGFTFDMLIAMPFIFFGLMFLPGLKLMRDAKPSV